MSIGKTQIIVALIGFAGVVVAGLISVYPSLIPENINEPIAKVGPTETVTRVIRSQYSQTIFGLKYMIRPSDSNAGIGVDIVYDDEVVASHELDTGDSFVNLSVGNCPLLRLKPQSSKLWNTEDGKIWAAELEVTVQTTCTF